MEANQHTMANLFSQLGLANGPQDIDAFIAAHRPLANGIPFTGHRSGILPSAISSRRRSSTMPTGPASSMS